MAAEGRNFGDGASGGVFRAGRRNEVTAVEWARTSSDVCRQHSDRVASSSGALDSDSVIHQCHFHMDEDVQGRLLQDVTGSYETHSATPTVSRRWSRVGAITPAVRAAHTRRRSTSRALWELWAEKVWWRTTAVSEPGGGSTTVTSAGGQTFHRRRGPIERLGRTSWAMIRALIHAWITSRNG